MGTLSGRVTGTRRLLLSLLGSRGGGTPLTSGNVIANRASTFLFSNTIYPISRLQISLPAPMNFSPHSAPNSVTSHQISYTAFLSISKLLFSPNMRRGTPDAGTARGMKRCIGRVAVNSAEQFTTRLVIISSTPSQLIFKRNHKLLLRFLEI